MGRLKTAEEAKGIPSRAVFKDPPNISKPALWKATIHRHLADKAGDHLDIRFGDIKSGITYSWATRKIPEPGTGTYAIMQPTHSMEYMDWAGKIPKGSYGAGEVRVERKEPVEVREANKDLLRINLYTGRVPEQLVFRRVEGNKWVLHNATPSRTTKRWGKLIPEDKPRYKEKSVDSVDYGDDDEIMQAKVDGAHVLGVYEKGKPIRLLSYRKAKSTPTGILEHTYKPRGMQGYKVPTDLHGSLVRGELYAVDRRGRALPAERVGGLLNASTWKSREKQSMEKVRLKFAPFDILRSKGRNVSSKPYKERFALLQELVKASPADVELPDTAFTQPQKYRLLKKILDGKLKQTSEGVVLWHRDRPIVTKVKKVQDHDVHVRGIYPSTHEGWAGGFEYSYTPRGKVVGRVGGGMTHKMREDMHKNPAEHVGRVAKVKAQGVFLSGALRSPEFKEYHIEKGKQI